MQIGEVHDLPLHRETKYVQTEAWKSRGAKTVFPAPNSVAARRAPDQRALDPNPQGMPTRS